MLLVLVSTHLDTSAPAVFILLHHDHHHNHGHHESALPKTMKYNPRLQQHACLNSLSRDTDGLRYRARGCVGTQDSRPMVIRSEYHGTTIDAVHHHTNPNFSNSLVVPCVLRLASWVRLRLLAMLVSLFADGTCLCAWSQATFASAFDPPTSHPVTGYLCLLHTPCDTFAMRSSVFKLNGIGTPFLLSVISGNEAAFPIESLLDCNLTGTIQRPSRPLMAPSSKVPTSITPP
ncbi:hypothetical protein CFIO01_02600 [Colletotrichum fioriniae PJ7]|uniref:Uncharacterized protein n=1 Tax=Colletotrichum fioriniae PJ7 TaxID=1445577 RepID=A0A010QP74_9PEZI|nr:hypothetical protein CFIO01_02600 [Colletotrichum fioriniae PJ7]